METILKNRAGKILTQCQAEFQLLPENLKKIIDGDFSVREEKTKVKEFCLIFTKIFISILFFKSVLPSASSKGNVLSIPILFLFVFFPKHLSFSSQIWLYDLR
jgi:hypothetical protein